MLRTTFVLLAAFGLLVIAAGPVGLAPTAAATETCPDDAPQVGPVCVVAPRPPRCDVDVKEQDVVCEV